MNTNAIALVDSPPPPPRSASMRSSPRARPGRDRRGGAARRDRPHGGFSRMFAIKLLHTHLAEESVHGDAARRGADRGAGFHHSNVRSTPSTSGSSMTGCRTS